jgi:hypothetical protein
VTAELSPPGLKAEARREDGRLRDKLFSTERLSSGERDLEPEVEPL